MKNAGETADPERAPIDGASPRPDRKRRALRWLLVAGFLVAAATLVIGAVIGARAIDWSDLPRILERLSAWRASPLAMLAMLACFVVGGLVVFPVNLLIAVAIVVFGPLIGVPIALAGSLASAAVLHQIGCSFPEHAWTRIANAHVERLRAHVAQHGVLAVAIVRVLPIAPYSIVSLAGGVAGIARAPFLAGTALGMTPGILLYAVFADRAREVIANPRPLSWAMLSFAVVLIVAVAFLLRLYRNRGARKNSDIR
jgi:phospholipase D1/2